MFHQRVEGTFEWFTTEHKTHISPSFAMIQSSGMGKTKLMKEYKTRFSHIHNCTALLLLCTEGTNNVPANILHHFDGILDVKSSEKRENILQQLDSLIPNSIMKSKSKVLLLVDEAQLLTQKDPGLYDAVRWWLRQVRSTPQIVAVFAAGTLMSLANYQISGPPLGSSRDPDVEYTNFNTRDTEALANDRKLRLYEPFSL